MKTDDQLKKDVEGELEWEPSVNAAHVGVAVKDGVVSLSGHLDTFAEKHHVERAALRVSGVRALAVELDVKLMPGHVRSDVEIARAAETALQWNALIPAEHIKVKVEKGLVTLTGEVEWDFQRRHAEKEVRKLTGVMGLTNHIALKPRVTPDNISARIRQALTRQAEREANAIDVQVTGSTATLQGQVHSWSERATAQGAAYSAPGITRVVNELHVTH